MASSTIPHIGEKFCAEIKITEPKNHREIRDLLVSLRGFAAVDGVTTKYAYTDTEGFDCCKLFDVTGALERLAAEIEPETLVDAVAAFDILLEMIEWNYRDNRDEKLAHAIRRSLAETIPASEWGRK